MKSIISTKKLSLSQKELLLNAGLSLVEYDAINIKFVDFTIPNNIKNAIFTSQNAVASFLKASNAQSSKIEKVFCVGEKTKEILEKNRLFVVKNAEYGSILADYIIKNHSDESFHFFCGNLRRDEIPSALKKAKIELFEVITYKTAQNLVKFERNFDGILFFSPSGVKSFISENNIANSTVFCIGTTTASEAKKYTNNVVLANATTIESVIAKAVKTLKVYD